MIWLGGKGERCCGVDGVSLPEGVVVVVSPSEVTGVEEMPDGVWPLSA